MYERRLASSSAQASAQGLAHYCHESANRTDGWLLDKFEDLGTSLDSEGTKGGKAKSTSRSFTTSGSRND